TLNFGDVGFRACSCSKSAACALEVNAFHPALASSMNKGLGLSTSCLTENGGTSRLLPTTLNLKYRSFHSSKPSPTTLTRNEVVDELARFGLDFFDIIISP